ncbi:hypothetical protein [Streptomyces sp. GC420]|uniref:hypothetical protein n=1 Tax=Streptomyces sp. GC420 TaxID=2697568 RepID=UPI001414EB62|nr:hypothetical protein [Streptomyces sp. GC420]NBM14550.1 hypothetical protein [Streptomyces sp. GC420]
MRVGRGTVVALTAVLAQLAGQGGAGAAGEPEPYRFASGATVLQGATGTTDAPRLTADGTYRSSIEPGGRRYYRVTLDDASDAYVSAVVVPGSTTPIGFRDGISLSLQNEQGVSCGKENADFGAAAYPRPLAAAAERTIKETGNCREAGSYFVVLERRTGTGTATGSQPWEVELQHVVEPPVRDATSGPAVNWQSASPTPPQEDEPRPRPGGAGFNDAGTLDSGVWRDTLTPGRTRFYRVPVGWGQQIFVQAELGGPPAAVRGRVSNALALRLYNPVRDGLDSVIAPYGGEPRTAALDPLPPVRYGNRYGVGDEMTGMRFAGWYYLAVTLSPEVGEKFGDGEIGLTLRVDVEGDAEEGPAYEGEADLFRLPAVGGNDGRSGDGGTDGAMRVLAAAGIGTGTLLVLWLALWRALARRRSSHAG